MKKSIVKNRKAETRKKRFFYVSIVLSCLFFLASLTLSYLFFLRPHVYISPLGSQGVSKVAGKTMQVASTEEVKQDLDTAKIVYQDILMQPDGSIVIKLDNNGEAIVGSQRDIYVQIASLQLITARLTMEGKRFSRLDLRYDKPVITF